MKRYRSDKVKQLEERYTKECGFKAKSPAYTDDYLSWLENRITVLEKIIQQLKEKG